MKKLITTFALSFALGVAAMFALQAHATLKVVQTPTVRLYTSESAGASSARITPYPVDLDGTKLTISDFGSSPTFTVDPKVSGYEEIEGFTGITDNGDGTATLTGLVRNLTSKYPYTTAGTGRQHGAGAVVVFGNNPQIYGRLAAKENDETITGQWTFTTFPITPNNATSTYATAGISQLATKSQQAAGTASSTPGAALILAAANASSTYGANSSGANKTVVTGSGGLIDPRMVFNGTNLTFPSTVGASSTVLATDSSGAMTWEPQDWQLLAATTTNIALGYATTTFAGATSLRVRIFIPGIGGGTANVALYFNSDAGSNYGDRYIIGPDTFTDSSIGGMQFYGNATSSATSSIVFDITNITNRAKLISWSGVFGTSGATAPDLTRGSGVWNNSSNQITTLVVNASNGSRTLNTGTRIEIWGSKN